MRDLTARSAILWAWFCTVDDEVLHLGARKIADLAGYQRDRYRNAMRELIETGYVTTVRSMRRTLTVKCIRRLQVPLGPGARTVRAIRTADPRISTK